MLTALLRALPRSAAFGRSTRHDSDRKHLASSSRRVLVQDTYSVEEIAILFRVSRNSVYEWHKREDDPLPLRRMNGKKRGFFAYRDELLEWSKRHAT